MKNCYKCGKEKPLNEFYRHSNMSDGYLGKCKECSRKDVRENRESKIEKYRAYDRKRGNRQTVEYHRDYRKRNPEKYKAKTAVNNAIRDGRLVKAKSCSQCNSTAKIYGHHYDYSKPLEVVWLCAPCHSKLHHTLKCLLRHRSGCTVGLRLSK